MLDKQNKNKENRNVALVTNWNKVTSLIWSTKITKNKTEIKLKLHIQ